MKCPKCNKEAEHIYKRGVMVQSLMFEGDEPTYDDIESGHILLDEFIEGMLIFDETSVEIVGCEGCIG